MPDQTEKVKPGYKTSEFWLNLLVAAIGFANQAGFLGQPIDPVAVGAIAAPVITYSFNRTAIKGSPFSLRNLKKLAGDIIVSAATKPAGSRLND